jgi:hypothetical protein
MIMQENTRLTPGISLSNKWGMVRIFHATIVALGEPKYIRFLFNPEKNRLAVQSCKRKVAESFRVPKHNPEDWNFKINSLSMTQMIWKNCGWDGEQSYRVMGTVYVNYDLVEFDLMQAAAISAEEFEH